MSWTPSLVTEASFELRHAAWAAVALNLGVADPLLGSLLLQMKLACPITF